MDKATPPTPQQQIITSLQSTQETDSLFTECRELLRDSEKVIPLLNARANQYKQNLAQQKNKETAELSLLQQQYVEITNRLEALQQKKLEEQSEPFATLKKQVEKLRSDNTKNKTAIQDLKTAIDQNHQSLKTMCASGGITATALLLFCLWYFTHGSFRSP